MIHVAQEMQREGLRLPLLIGGATTSRGHTAVKIAPHYQASTVHVLDASRAVGVVNSLLNEELKTKFDKKIREDYERLRQEHAAKTRRKKLLTLEEARALRTPIDWSTYLPPKPEFLGVRIYASEKTTITLADLVPFIDWSPFFHAWELRGRYPAIFDDPKIGKQARELFDDAQALLGRIVRKNLLVPRGVHALWRANSVGDDVDVYSDEARSEKVATFYFLRQQMQKSSGQSNYCLADFISPESAASLRLADSGGASGTHALLQDYLGGFAVSIHGAAKLAKEFKRKLDDYSPTRPKPLPDQWLKAFAE